jgi:RNA polymerase sigma-70 factor (ECF subfamily)
MQTMSDEVLCLLADTGIAHGDQSAGRDEALTDCLGRLKAEDRALIEERYYHERAPKEIARTNSRSVHSVYRALARIHIALRECVHRTLARE